MAYTKDSSYYVNASFRTSFPGGSTNHGVNSMKMGRSRTGENNLGYKDKISLHQSATSPMTAFEDQLIINRKDITVYAKPGYQSPVITNWHTALPIQSWYGTSYPEFLSLNRVSDAIATSQFNNKVKEKQAPFEGLIFLGELGQTIRLLRNPFRSTLELTKNLAASIEKTKKGRKVKRFGGHLGEGVADMWLEYRFGVLPLLSDIDSILKEVARLAEKEQTFGVKAYGTSESAIITPYSNLGLGLSTIKFHGDIHLILKSETFIRSGVFWEHFDSTKSSVKRILEGLGDATDIPSAIYNLTPWTFLLDYFVNLGNFIDGTIAAQTSVSYFSKTVVTTATRELICNAVTVNVPNKSGTRVDAKDGYSTVLQKRRTVQRTGTLSTIPPIVFHLPGSNVRYANMAALFRSSISKSSLRKS